MADGAALAPKGADRLRMASLDDHLQREIDRGVFPGALTRIWRGDRLIHENALGYRDVERRAPVTRDTLFRLYSMSKLITSVALLQLYERGLVRLDQPVSDFIPSWANLQVRSPADRRATVPCERPMSVRDLLSHQSGLGAAHAAKPASGDRPAIPPARTFDETIERLSHAPLSFQPGAEFDYGVSTDICGYLVQVISGERFDRYLQRWIFEPLGMTETGFSVAPDKADRLSALYTKSADGLSLREDPQSSPLLGEITYHSGAGGLVGTTDDYERFGRMLLGRGQLDGQRILGRKTLELMTLNHLTGGRTIAEAVRNPFFLPFTGQGFGLGFGVMLDPAAAQLSGSPGEFYWTGAAGTLCFVDPAEDLMCLFMTQAMPPIPVEDARNPYGWREIRAIIYAALD
jgi:CubicO group peptidase (beta-lactamase class C family)